VYVTCIVRNDKFNKHIYLTLYTFSFEINESRLSDTRCLIQYVVSPHCGDKRMARRCTRRSLYIVCWYNALYQVEPVV
jgi:hypothetical protein